MVQSELYTFRLVRSVWFENYAPLLSVLYDIDSSKVFINLVII